MKGEAPRGPRPHSVESAARRSCSKAPLSPSACPQAARAATPAGGGRAPFVPPEGVFHCYFSRQGVDALRAPCRIARAAGGALLFESGGGGSPQLAGALHEVDHHSFRFEGALAEPGADVTPASATFEVVDAHVYRGRVPAPRGPLWVTIAYVPRPGRGGVTLP